MAVPRIVGGVGVSIADFPFQVALYDPRAPSVAAGFFCGGVIIDATHVATAAHCAIDETTGRVTSPRDIAVLAGTGHLLSVGEPLAGGAIEDPATATSVDPSYNSSTNDYDVALIRLARPLWPGGAAPAIDGRNTIAPIQMSAALASAYADPNLSARPILATVSGWGDTHAEPSGGGLGGAYRSDLRATQIPLVSGSACGSAYAGPSPSQSITSRMLCAGFPSGGRDSCYGDSGGPLLVDRATPADPPGDYVLAGLVSFGEGCAQPESPGVYTSIANPAIARFLASNPAQTPLQRGVPARPRYVHTCTRGRRPCHAPSVAGHHHHHHSHHHPHRHARAS